MKYKYTIFGGWHLSTSISKFKIFKICVFGMLLLTLSKMQNVLDAQALRPSEDKKSLRLPTYIGDYYLIASSDFRTQLVDRNTLNNRVKSGKVYFYDGFYFKDGCLKEESTNRWITVADALRDMSMLDRTNKFPQIRVVQRDTISQSSISYPPTGPESGFSTEFLSRKLYAGDFLIESMNPY